MSTKYLLSFELTTDADPSLLLDALNECAESLVENLDSAHDESADLDEDSPSVDNLTCTCCKCALEEKEGGGQ